MAIGKPLLVKERQGVQQSVLAAQGQPLSANVPAQKLQFADYNIGMQSALASHAVGKELANMVGAGVQAKLYIDQTKQEYQRLNLMEEWQKADTQYNADFAKAMTPEAQQGVLDAYSKDLETRTTNWRKALPNTADSQKYLSFLRNGSQKQYSKFSTNVAQGLHKRTVDLEQLNIKRIAQSLVTEKNSDVVSGMNATQASYANLVKIGALQPEAAEFAYSQLQDTVVNGRANLFAADLAKEYALGGAPLPTDEELNERLNSAMGMKLDDRRLTMARETYTDAFYKEVTEFNRQSNAEETMAKRNMRSKIAAFEAEYKQQLLDMDGRADPEWIARTVERAKQFDTAWQPGYSQELERKLKGLKWGDASATQIEHFTEGEGVEYIQTYLKRKGSHFLDLEELEHLMRSQKGDYAGMNERTILGIVKYWRKENEGIRQNVHKASESILQSTLMDSLKNPAILNKDAMNDALWSALGAKGFATSLNWQNVFSNDPEYQTAFQTVKGLIQTAHDQGTGPFQDKYMQLPHNERIVHLEDFIKMQVGKVFGQVTAKQMQQKRQEQATLEQRGEAEARTSISQTFQAGGKDPRTKRMVPGAISYRTASTAAELEAQRTEAYNSFKSRIDTERKRLEYEALPEPVKFIDRFIPTMPKVEVGSPTLSSIGSAIMGSTPAGYITDKLNRQLQNTMEEKLGRPLTEGELAGEDQQVNELASMIIKEKEQSTVGKFFDWFWSDGSSSDREIAMDNLLYDIKNKSLEGIKRGVEQVQPPTEAQPTTEVLEESIPVAKQPPTAVDDLVKGMADNPIVQTLVGGANQVFGAGAEAEAAPASQYAVQAGDTMSSIARQYGIPVNELIALNPNISDPNVIGIGDAINVPQQAMPPRISQDAPAQNVDTNIQQWLDAINRAEGGKGAETPLGMGHGSGKPAKTSEEAYRRGKAWINRRIKEFESNKGRKIKFAAERGLLNPNPTLEKAVDSSGRFTPAFQRYMAEQWAPGSVSKNKKFLDTLRPAEREKNPNWLANVQQAYSGNQTPASLDSEPETLSPSLASEVVPTAPKLYAKAMSGDRGVWKEDVFSGEEQSQLKDIVAKKIKQGKFLISYSDYDEEGGSKISYGMEMPDSSQGLKFALGKAQIVRHGDKILVVDEWDIDSPEKINEMQFFDKVGTIYEKMRSGDISMYGLAHLMGEAFGPQSGEGASIRATIGTAKSLKLSKAQLAKIPQLKDYEASNKHRINPDNLGQFA